MTITRHIKSQLESNGAARHWLFLGVGYSAKALISRLSRDPHVSKDLHLVGTSRNPERWPAALKAQVQGIEFTGAITPALEAALAQAEIIITSLPPSKEGDPFLSALFDRANTANKAVDMQSIAPNLRWAGYLSATSVYGDRGGQWAFEDELLKPTAQRGYHRAAAEIAWLETGWPVHIFRLAGIYGGRYFGQTRNPFARLTSGRARAVIKPDHVVNRIHAEDIASAICASISAPNPLRIYNLADDAPAPPQNVLDYAADLSSQPLPPRVGVDSADISDMARSFYGETKRISNGRARSELGWTPAFPNYQSGLMSVFKQDAALQALAHQAGTTPCALVILTGHIDAPIKRRRIIARALLRHMRLSQDEAGCLRFDVRPDPDIEGRFHVVKIFKNQAAFDQHQQRSKASDWQAASQGVKRHYIKG